MSNTDAILARSNELLQRVRKQIEDSPSFLADLVKPPKTPVAVPFAPTAISLDETGHSVQSAGDLPSGAASPKRTPANDEENQRRMREFFASRLSTFASRLDATQQSQSGIQEELKVEAKKDEEQHMASEDEEEPEDEIIDQKPLLDEPFVFVDARTTLTVPELPLLSQASVPYPIQRDDVPLVGDQNIAEDGLWVPDLPLCKPENVKRMEYRLLWEDPERERYFGADMAMKIDTPPLSQIPPPFPIEPYDHYGRGLISYAPASVWGVEDIDIRREFRIEVRYVKFLVHPLSCLEEILAMKIRQLYDAYIKDQDFKRTVYYQDKIKALRTAWLSIRGDEEKKEQEIKYLKELAECRDMKEMEEHNSRMIREHLQQANHDLKELRSAAVTVCPLTLRWRRRNFTPEEKEKEQKEFDSNLQHRIQEEVRLGELQGEEIEPGYVKQRVLERIDELGLRKPGDPLWRPVIENNAEVTPNEECPPLEQERKEQVSKAQIFLKYYVNKQEQLKTSTVPIDQSYTASIEEGTKLLSNVIPHKISIEIWETGYLKGNRFIASVTLPITVGTSPEFGIYEFTSDLTNPDGQLVMGTVSARCYVVPEENGQIFIRCPDITSQKTKRRLAQDPSSFMSVARLIEWAENHDPNDPYTAAILSQVIAQRTAERVVGKFRLDSALVASTFASLAPSSPGLDLQQRIERMRLKDEQERKRKKEKKEEEDDFLSQLQKNELVQQTKITRALQLTDIVRECPIPTVPTFFGWFREIMSMYRPLKPIRTPRIMSDKLETFSRAVVRIIRGQNIPERTLLGVGPGTNASLIYSSTESLATNCFVRITYLNETFSTRCVDGSVNAEWNENFDFQLDKENEIEPDLNKISKNKIRIDLFDRITFKVVTDDREQQMHHELTEERILGTIEIPISTLMADRSVEGRFPLVAPPFQLSYSKPESPLRLHIYATIDPPIKLEERNDELISNETEELIIRAQQWLDKIKQQTASKERRFILMAKLRTGKTIVSCRMIRKQAPPEGIDDTQNMLRFVSMIPNYSDAEVFNAPQDVWCTSQEFLTMGAGDEEEHAALLCNYFKYKGLDAYMVFGYDIINGTTTFVATKEANRVTLWDPLTGLSYSSKDDNCTLYSVGMICNQENVWANVQSDVAPFRIDWNIYDKKKWSPFFTPEFPLPRFDTPQEEVLQYKDRNESKARQVQRELDNAIKNSIESWRQHQRTSWNPQFSEKIRNALENCERAAMSDPKITFQSIIEDISSINRSYRMTGGPFCMTYIKTQTIIQEVKARGMWKTESPNADFALGVYVVPYPNDILVCWVMVAVLEYIQEARPPL